MILRFELYNPLITEKSKKIESLMELFKLFYFIELKYDLELCIDFLPNMKFFSSNFSGTKILLNHQNFGTVFIIYSLENAFTFFFLFLFF